MENLEFISEVRQMGEGRAKGRREDGLRLEPVGCDGPYNLTVGWLRAGSWPTWGYLYCPSFVLTKCSIKPAMQRNKCLMRIACFY